MKHNQRMESLRYLFLIFLFATGNLRFAIAQSNDPAIINCIATNDKNIYVGTKIGVFVSEDLGKNWAVLNNGFNPIFETNISSISVDKELIGAIQHRSVYYSVNGGKKWVKMYRVEVSTNAKEDLTAIKVMGRNVFVSDGSRYDAAISRNSDTLNTLKYSPGVPDDYYVSCADYSVPSIVITSSYKGSFFSNDDGVSFTKLKKLPKGAWNLFLIDNFVFSQTSNGFVRYDLSQEKGVTKCNGEFPIYSAVKSFTLNNGRLYAFFDKGIVFYSVDNGENWLPFKPSPFIEDATSIAFCGKAMVILKDNELYCSENNGIDWIKIKPGLDKVYSIAKADISENYKKYYTKLQADGVENKKQAEAAVIAKEAAEALAEKAIQTNYKNTTGKNIAGIRFITYQKDKKACNVCVPTIFEQRFPGVWKDGIDDAVTVGNDVYFFRGYECIIFDLVSGKVKEGPKKIAELFPGVFDFGIDAVVNSNNGGLYFFKENYMVYFSLETKSIDRLSPMEAQERFSTLNNYDPQTGLFDGAINWGNDQAYMFRNKEYSTWNMKTFEVEKAPKFISNLLTDTRLDSISGAFNISDNEVVFYKNPPEYDQICLSLKEREKKLATTFFYKIDKENRFPGMDCRTCHASGHSQEIIPTSSGSNSGTYKAPVYSQSDMTTNVFGEKVVKNNAIGSNGGNGVTFKSSIKEKPNYKTCWVCNGNGHY
ncbi:MAG: hypothetical protein V4547_04140 [Bacteroidota bacterium]